jgi:hypothetical protein
LTFVLAHTQFLTTNFQTSIAMKLTRKLLFLKLAGICVFLLFCCFMLAGYWTSEAQSTSLLARWRPRKEVADVRFVGSETCALCHTEIFETQRGTAMNQALQLASDSPVLVARPPLNFRIGSYNYTITRQGNQSIYTVTDGKKSISVPLLYSFGQSKAGQTYVFQRDGAFYESRVSYYTDIKNLDFTIGSPRTEPKSLEDALGRRMSNDETIGCFSCHATGVTTGGRLNLEKMTPGVSCEACHGPGSEHVALFKNGIGKDKPADSRIFNPSSLSPDEQTQEHCGSCHRSSDDVLSSPMMSGSIENVRFQPYRIFGSEGHNPNDPRLSCTACHNPHQNLKHGESSIAHYDAKCTTCHAVNQRLLPENQRRLMIAKTRQPKADDAAPCPVAAVNCASCHMPKVDLPNAHFKFTDHRIRIARPGDSYPK